MMKRLRRIWDYFFTKVADPPLPIIKESRSSTEKHEVKFFEPVSFKEKFDKSKSLKDFIKKIDTHE